MNDERDNIYIRSHSLKICNHAIKIRYLLKYKCIYVNYNHFIKHYDFTTVFIFYIFKQSNNTTFKKITMKGFYLFDQRKLPPEYV